MLLYTASCFVVWFSYLTELSSGKLMVRKSFIPPFFHERVIVVLFT